MSEAPRRQSRIQKKNREAILAAALQEFSAQGFAGTTIDRIAETAGLSKPNVLYYFPSKEAIHRELLMALLDLWLSPLRDLRAEGDPVDSFLPMQDANWNCRATTPAKAGFSPMRCCRARRDSPDPGRGVARSGR